MDLNQFKKLPVMGIIRGIKSDDLGPLIETIIDSGLKTIEITLNTDNAFDLIKRAVGISKGRLNIGAGTVLSKEEAKKAENAGASFFVSPVLVYDISEYCAEREIPYFPGALTPTEVLRAWEAGARMVKIFPASSFGSAYFKILKGPFRDIELMAVGGITDKNVNGYLQNGAAAVAFGASIFKKELIDKKDFKSIKKNVSKFIKTVSGFHNI